LREGQTLVIPPPATEITPEVAHRWLRERLGAYMEITAAGALADGRETLLAQAVEARTLLRDRWRDGRDLDAVFDELEKALAERRRGETR